MDGVKSFTVVLALIVGLAIGGWAAATAAEDIQVRGVVTASQHESDEGYFALDQEHMLMVRPGTPLHRWLKAHVGRRVVLTLAPDSASE
jgi:hypothetical protein